MTVDTPSLASLSARLISEVRLIDAYAKRTNFYGPADALREHIAKALRCADELDALQRHLLDEKTEDLHTRMVNADPAHPETPRRP